MYFEVQSAFEATKKYFFCPYTLNTKVLLK